jgi:peptidoglycan/LPS O-acetylase OafA/YrhL
VPLILLLPYLFELTRSSKVDRAIASWSYPIYLVHALVLMTYAPLRHYVPQEYYSLAVLSLTLAGSLLAVRLDAWIETRLKRVPRRENSMPQGSVAPPPAAPAFMDAS